MKLNHYIYSLIAGLVLMLSACSPDEYDMGKKTYVSDDLAEGIAYTVTIAGNQVRLKSNITGCTPLWVTPQGRSQESELAIELPFAGSYEVTFGVETPGGVVYGEPYTFSLAQNDFSLLEDEKWFLLSAKISPGNTPSLTKTFCRRFTGYVSARPVKSTGMAWMR